MPDYIQHIEIPSRNLKFKLILDLEKKIHRDIAGFCKSFGAYELQETQLMLDIVPEGGTVFDVGAHIGWFSILCGALVSSTGQVFAFEPNDINYSYLVRNLDANKSLNIIPVKSVVSDTNNKVLFYTNLDNDGGHSLWNPAFHDLNRLSQRQEQSHLVQSVTIDTFCLKHKIDKIDLLKIDVEGAEVKVLHGAKDMLSRKSVSHVIAEVNDTGLEFLGTSKIELLSFMKSNGYACKGLFDNRVEGEVFNIHFYLR